MQDERYIWPIRIAPNGEGHMGHRCEAFASDQYSDTADVWMQNDCPFHLLPSIGFWQNPHHTDRHTYQRNKPILDRACWVIRKLLDLACMNNRCAGEFLENADEPVATNESWQSETKQHTFRESYVFHTIPKIPGVEPGREAIEDGFMLLIEGFRFRQFLFLVAVILWFTVYGLIFDVHFRYIAGLQGPKLYLRLVEICKQKDDVSKIIGFKFQCIITNH